MLGPSVFVKTISSPTRVDAFGNQWQYHSQSDHHSKVACALIMLDLLNKCTALAMHARLGKIAFGINHEMRDFRNNRKKNLDLVVCTPAGGGQPSGISLFEYIKDWKLVFTKEEADLVAQLPILRRDRVGSVLMALEAKACMTEHQKALPRLYDELNSSHLTIHGAAESAIAVGLVCVNAAEKFLSPARNKRLVNSSPTWSIHKQPKAAAITLAKIHEVPRRARAGDEGFDALGVLMVSCSNDGSAVELVNELPAPAVGDIFHYNTMIDRIGHAYATRFAAI